MSKISWQNLSHLMDVLGKMREDFLLPLKDETLYYQLEIQEHPASECVSQCAHFVMDATE